MKKEMGIVRRENGEIMLEATIVLLPTLIIILAMISLSFLFYEQSLVNTVATEIASEIGRFYKYSKRYDDEMGVNILSDDDIKNGKLFSSSFAIWSIQNQYEELAKEYAKERIAIATLGLDNSDLEVTCDIQNTAPGRAYVKVIVSQKTEFFLYEIWNMIGEDGVAGITDFTGVAYAECSDLMGYTSMINFIDYWTTVVENEVEIVEEIDGLIDAVKSLIDAGQSLLVQ